MSAPAPYPDLTLGGKGFKFTYDAAHNTFRFTSGPLAGTTGDVLVVDGKPALSFNTNTDNIECKPK